MYIIILFFFLDSGASNIKSLVGIKSKPFRYNVGAKTLTAIAGKAILYEGEGLPLSLSFPSLVEWWMLTRT